MTAAHARRLREMRSRILVRAFDHRQRRHAHGVWFRLRRVLTFASEAYALSRDEGALLFRDARGEDIVNWSATELPYRPDAMRVRRRPDELARLLMRDHLRSLLVLLAVHSLCVVGDAGIAGAAARTPVEFGVSEKPIHVVLVGDSTVTDRSGWGLGFRQYLGDAAICTNLAQPGRSSKSYLAEGHWDQALTIGGHYYLIQFGHNDQPGKGPERETDPATTYTANLARYVEEARAIGATPVLVSPLTRRNFSRTAPDRVDSTLTPYAEAVKKLAAEKNVPVVDLHARSVTLVEQLGPAETAKFDAARPDGSRDTTHLDATGSEVFARLVVEELRRVVPALDPVLLAEPRAAKLIDLEYGQAGGEQLLLDVSVPPGPGPFPVAILVHGGGWSGGDKGGADKPGSGADITPWFDWFTDAQFTWFSINYRLAPSHRWPACFDDVQAAIRWVRAHAAELKGDPTRIALVGHSAGGHLTALAAMVVDDSVRVQAVVGYAPVTNHEQDLPARGGLSPSLQGLLNRSRDVTPESLGLLRAISPLQHVRPGLPPFLLLHGDADRTVPIQQSLDFQAKLRANGVRADLIVVPGAAHRLTDWDRFMPDHGARMVAWLREILGAPVAAGRDDTRLR